MISGNLLYDLTDHFPKFRIINDFPCSTNQGNIYRRDYSNFDGESFAAEVRGIDWDDVNLIFNTF